VAGVQDTHLIGTLLDVGSLIAMPNSKSPFVLPASPCSSASNACSIGTCAKADASPASFNNDSDMRAAFAGASPIPCAMLSSETAIFCKSVCVSGTDCIMV
jgi:hypothetical protein